jgi:hypothetical protein
MQGAAVAQTLRQRSRKDVTADEGPLKTKPSMARMNSMDDLLDEIGEDDPSRHGGKRVTVKEASSATGGALNAATFDLNKDGVIDEDEMERIRLTAHLSAPERVRCSLIVTPVDESIAPYRSS